MNRRPKTRIRRALDKVLEEISGSRRDGAALYGRYAGGLASEGWAGGYAQALRDVLLVLDGVPPNTSYWREE